MIIGGRIMWSHLKMQGVTVSVRPAPKPKIYMLKVQKMLDMGRHGRTAIVEPFAPDDGFEMVWMDEGMQREEKPRLPIPYKIGALKCLYASKKPIALTDMDYVMNCTLSGRRIEKIVLDVLMPGDLLIVKPKKCLSAIKSIEALRIVSRYKKQKGQYLYAV